MASRGIAIVFYIKEDTKKTKYTIENDAEVTLNCTNGAVYKNLRVIGDSTDNQRIRCVNADGATCEIPIKLIKSVEDLTFKKKGYHTVTVG